MEAIRKINLPELAQPNSEDVSLAQTSSKPLPPGMGHSLALMMAQAQAAKPNQTLPEGTPDMYLVEWEEMALRYGLVRFRDALSTAMRADEFFPSPHDIREICKAQALSDDDRRRALRHIADVDAWRATWERERAEDAAKATRTPPEGA